MLLGFSPFKVSATLGVTYNRIPIPHVRMEVVGLVFDPSLQVIICLEHGYCLPRLRVLRHLQDLHKVKGPRLKAACEEIGALELADLSNLDIPSGRTPIPYLTIDAGFQCAVPACNLGKGSLSRNWNTVKKHLSIVHSIRRRGGTPPLQVNDIREVRLQSLQPTNLYRPFVVQETVATAALADIELYTTEERR